MRYGAERVFSSEASNITEEDVDALIAKVQGQGWPLPWLGMRSDVVSTSLRGQNRCHPRRLAAPFEAPAHAHLKLAAAIRRPCLAG